MEWTEVTGGLGAVLLAGWLAGCWLAANLTAQV